MRFGATLSVAGLAWLEKRFLPAFEKLGSKELALLLTPTLVHLVRAQRRSIAVEYCSALRSPPIFHPGSIGYVPQTASRLLRGCLVALRKLCTQ